MNCVSHSYQILLGLKFVAKTLVGMVSLFIFGVVQDWYCLVDSLVTLGSRVTCTFNANTTYVAFIYMYVSLCVHTALYLFACTLVICVHVLHTCFIC